MESHPCAALPALLKPAFHRFPAACTKPALLGQVLQCQQQVTRLRGVFCVHRDVNSRRERCKGGEKAQT